MKLPSRELFDRLIQRAIYYSTQMIHLANNREDVQKGDPKIGGHQAAAASSAHILGALHLFAKNPQDFLAVKPHASPMDHAYNHMLRLFHHFDSGEPFTDEESKKVMTRLRAFMDPSDPDREPAFQSYHAFWDPDSFHFFPSGSVGIPPVMAAYTALAYRYAEKHHFQVGDQPHFWCIIGDSEFREGSLAECMPDAAERELNNVTWIVDYNRQNLDGTRIVNEEGIQGTDADRIERLAKANGWNVIQARHGKKRQAFFEKAGNQELQIALEKLPDFELQALLTKRDGKAIRLRLIELVPSLKNKLLRFTDQEMVDFLENLGGHDIELLAEVFTACRKSTRPTMVIAHTIKGWGLEIQATTGNHSALVSDEDVERLRKQEGIPSDDLFAYYDEHTPEAAYLKQRGAFLRQGFAQQKSLKGENLSKIHAAFEEQGGFPTEFGINLKLSPWANTQWMWGQLASRLSRIAFSAQTGQELNEEEKRWALAAQYLITMAPDVGTSTNLNPSMDGKIFGPHHQEDFESLYQVKDKRRPDLVPLEKETSRHLRFEIEEGNSMSCAGSFGKMGDHIGIPLLPLMTVYDFFIKRALDQYFYNLYWQSSFILVGTPSGITLSPEGAQHSWKSDLQIPNGITWEPAFAIEMDWILADAIRRHITQDNQGREGVLIRAVTRGIEQRLLTDNLKNQLRFSSEPEQDIFNKIRLDVLRGGYWVIHHEGKPGYVPGDNVIHFFAMGALVIEAIHASQKLLDEGIYANVLVVTSPDLLIGNLARADGYAHLKQNLGVSGNLYLNSTQHLKTGRTNASTTTSPFNRTDVLSLRGSRIPILAVCDGEPGLLDNIGSIVGVPQETLAVRKHSKSGRPVDVYRYHHMDPDSIVEATHQLFEQSASETFFIEENALKVR